MTIAEGQVVVAREVLTLGHEPSSFRSILSFEDRGDTWTQAECLRCGMSFDVRWSREMDQCWCVARKVNPKDRWAKPMKFGPLPPTCEDASIPECQGVWSFGLEEKAS